jgi:hypothetical protein
LRRSFVIALFIEMISLLEEQEGILGYLRVRSRHHRDTYKY